MQDYQNNIKRELDLLAQRLSEDVASMHASRATPALVENVRVPAYGSTLPLKELASISAADARTLIVQPWDSGALAEIQNALAQSHSGFGVTADEKFIRVTIPQLSEERRREIIRALGKRVEEARIAVRSARDRAMKSLEEAERAKEISEDVKFRTKQAIQKIVDEYNKKSEDLQAKKEAEIARV